MKILVGFIVGLIIGGGLISTYFISQERNPYVELKEDFLMDNGGVIKKGTLLRYDQGFPEGFTRYVLYVNISEHEKSLTLKNNEASSVISYWLSIDQRDTVSFSK